MKGTIVSRRKQIILHFVFCLGWGYPNFPGWVANNNFQTHMSHGNSVWDNLMKNPSKRHPVISKCHEKEIRTTTHRLA